MSHVIVDMTIKLHDSFQFLKKRHMRRAQFAKSFFRSQELQALENVRDASLMKIFYK